MLLAELLKALVIALEALQELSMGLKILLVFEGLPDETIQSMMRTLIFWKNFTYLGCVVQNNGGSLQEVLWIGLADCKKKERKKDLLSMSIWHCQCLCRTKIQIFKALVHPVLQSN